MQKKLVSWGKNLWFPGFLPCFSHAWFLLLSPWLHEVAPSLLGRTHRLGLLLGSARARGAGGAQLWDPCKQLLSASSAHRALWVRAVPVFSHVKYTNCQSHSVTLGKHLLECLVCWRFLAFETHFVVWEVKPGDADPRTRVYFSLSQNCVPLQHGKKWSVAIVMSRRGGNNFYSICKIHYSLFLQAETKVVYGCRV